MKATRIAFDEPAPGPLDVKVYDGDGTLVRIIPGALLIQRGAVKPHTMKIPPRQNRPYVARVKATRREDAMTRAQWRAHHARSQARLHARPPRGKRPTRGRPPLGPPPCHPERAYYARGMCEVCYSRWWRLQRGAPTAQKTARR